MRNDELRTVSYLSFIIPHSSLACYLLRAFAHVFDCALEEEGLFGQVVAFAVNDLAEAANGVFDLDVSAFEARELRGDEEWLREEALNFARPRDDQFVFFRQLVEAEDGDDVLQLFVALQNPFHI